MLLSCAKCSYPVSSSLRSHENKIMDEQMKPILIHKQGCIQDGDTLVFIDFRSGTKSCENCFFFKLFLWVGVEGRECGC